MKLIDAIIDAPVGKVIEVKGRTGTPLWWTAAHVVGRGLHSSTSQLILSRL
jgi:hypothetical protein